MNIDRQLSWSETSQPGTQSAVSLEDWKRDHLAHVPTRASAALHPVGDELLATISDAQKNAIGSVLIPQGALEDFLHAFLGPDRTSSVNRRSIDEASRWLASHSTGEVQTQSKASGSGPLELTGDPRLPDPPPVPK